jgi:hemerythrin
MYFDWKEEYSVNVSEIDEQHKKLFEIGGRIYDLVQADDEFDHYDEILTILEELKNYTIFHFDFEENLMKQYGYEEVDTHKFEHVFLIKKLQKLNNEDIDTKQKKVKIELITFIADWIAGHILKTDMKYKEFFNSKGLM